jgi:pyruvate-ferredoxin/flavodoxin oxidoreductase
VLVDRLRPQLDAALGADAVDAILAGSDDQGELAIREQRVRVDTLKAALVGIDDEDARRLIDLAGTLTRKSVWIVGGDGWAYDIGAGGLDHVLGSGRNVNILVLDTEVYSNTGGQASKATPRGAVAKFAAGGKSIMKKDLGLEAMTYGDVYVARIALGASDVQTVKALLEADAWPGVSLVIAYSTCIAHGFDMNKSMTQQKLAVQTGHWPLYRFRPSGDDDAHPFQLDSAEPSIAYADFASSEARFAMLARANPDRAKELVELAQADVDTRFGYYRQLAEVQRTAPGHALDTTIADSEEE